jgi:hypothetical protein
MTSEQQTWVAQVLAALMKAPVEQRMDVLALASAAYLAGVGR